MRRAQLIPFPLLALVIGLAYVLGDPRRTATPSFNTARELAHSLGATTDGIQLFGVFFLMGAVVMATTLITDSPRVMATALTIGGFMYVWWGALFAISAIVETRASLTGWAIYAFVAYGHFINAYRIRTGAHP